jgi:Abnormal spindle-like microcephaly-assoc'd, ASPM-SPD-2-Hydin
LGRIILSVALVTIITISATLSVKPAGAQQAPSASPDPNCSNMPTQTVGRDLQPMAANKCDRAAISVSSINQDFGSVKVGTNSSPQTVTATNTGDVPVNILLSFSENNPPFNVTLGNNCSNLQPAQACQIQAVFHPRKPDPITVIMTVVGRPVSGSLPDSTPQIVSLTGVGV